MTGLITKQVDFRKKSGFLGKDLVLLGKEAKIKSANLIFLALHVVLKDNFH